MHSAHSSESAAAFPSNTVAQRLGMVVGGGGGGGGLEEVHKMFGMEGRREF